MAGDIMSYLLGAIIGYFAMSGYRIPPEHARLYVGLFFLGSLTALIGDLYQITPGPLKSIFLLFPPDPYIFTRVKWGCRRLSFGGAMVASINIFSYLLAKYGVRGVFLSGKNWRWVVLFLTSICSLFGGFRSG